MKGKYYLSKFKGSGATLINPSRSKRFIDFKDDNPGPGTYNPNVSISTDGSYFVSQFKSSLCRTFGNSMRKNHSISTNIGIIIFSFNLFLLLQVMSPGPGPGSYRLPSDFGYYESATSHKALANSTVAH